MRRPPFLAGCCAAALIGSLLAVLAIRGDVLTGRARPVSRATATCGPIPDMAADRTAVPADSGVDAVFGLLPLLPLDDLGTVDVLPYNRYVTPAQYVHFSSSLLAGRTRSAMEDDGFRRADTIGYQAGKTIFGAEAIQLGSPNQAADFERRALASACQAGVATDVRPLAGIPGGVTFVYHDSDSPPFRATFLVGDTVVRLNVCLCVENRADPHVVLEAWAREVDTRMRTLFS